jgi:hypothetical protein
MKVCPQCGQSIQGSVNLCPTCGAALPEERRRIGNWLIDEFISEGPLSVLYKAHADEEDGVYLIRLFKPEACVGEKGSHLVEQLERLKGLPESHYIQHLEVGQTEAGEWFRRSEWFEAEDWPSLLAAGVFGDLSVMQRVFIRLAEILDDLHRRGFLIPHLILPDVLLRRLPSGGEIIKLDFRGSRFLSPTSEKPGTLVQQVIDRNPDIANGRALDERTDLWSLGKAYVEIMSGEMGLEDPLLRLKDLRVPSKLKALCEMLLDPDPDCRIQSSTELLRLLKEPETWEPLDDRPPSERGRERKPLKAFFPLFVLGIFLAAIVATLALFTESLNLSRLHKGESTPLPAPPDEACAREMLPGVAFVAVEYWLELDGKRVVRGAGTGTAFLVNRQGCLLSNRHVVCPWLENKELYFILELLKQNGKKPVFGYRIGLWFHGADAFQSGVVDSERFWDSFNAKEGYFSDGEERRVSILETYPVDRRPSAEPGAFATLDSDVAVLQVSPPSALPNALQLAPDHEGLSAGSKVYVLGYPLGSQSIPDSHALADIKSGEIGRVPVDHSTIQFSAPVHPGNSGGPLLGEGCKAIGIATSIQRLAGTGQLAPNLASALPVHRAKALLTGPAQAPSSFLPPVEGQPFKESAVSLAYRRKWKDAARQGELFLWSATYPPLTLENFPQYTNAIIVSSILYFGEGDTASARLLMEQLPKALSAIMRGSQDEKTRNAVKQAEASLWEDPLSRCLYTLIQDSAGAMANEPKGLSYWKGVDWRAEHEFYGYLAQLLSPLTRNDIPAILDGAESSAERALISLFLGRRLHLEGRPREATELLTDALSPPCRNPVYRILLMAELQHAQEAVSETLSGHERADYLARVSVLWEKIALGLNQMDDNIRDIKQLYSEIDAVKWCSESDDAKPCLALLDRKLRGLADLLGEVSPRADLAFVCASRGDWVQAAEIARSLNATGGRESAARLWMALLEVESLAMSGKSREATDQLREFAGRTREPFHRDVARCMLGDIPVEEMEARLKEGDPLDKQVFGLFVGLWNEALGSKARAMTIYSRILEGTPPNSPLYAVARSRYPQKTQMGQGAE